MHNTFLNRVSAERRVLSVVNERLPRDKQLTGLSQAAIERWRSVVGIGKTSSLSARLITLAERCQRLSDRSNETFLPVEKLDSEKIEGCLLDLQRELEACL
jgi:DNA repair protein RadC